MGASTGVTGVIVVDDDPLIRDILRAKLGDLGQSVFLASDGLEACALAARMRATLILLDLNMPRLNGLLACQRIRELPGYAHVPIIVLTSQRSSQAKAAAERTGATTFLTKPFRPTELMRVLSYFLPIDEGLREAIHRDADRADHIAHAPTMAELAPPKPPPGEPLHWLDRGRNVLTVLRA